MAALGPRCATAARHGRVTRSLSSPVCLGRHDGDTQRRRQLHASPPLLSSMRDPPLPPVVPGPGLRILDYFQPPPARRRSSSEEDKAKSARQLKYKDIAILGGGLTGLTTAFYLSRALAGVAGARITLYEANPERIGGWVRTDKVGGRESGRANETEEDGEDGVSAPTTRLELGPRTLRTQAGEAKWDDWVLFELVSCLLCS